MTARAFPGNWRVTAGWSFRVLASRSISRTITGGNYAENSGRGRGLVGRRGDQNTAVGVLHFPHGSISAFPHATSTVSQVNRHTCLLTIVQHGTYRLGRGTGRYVHLTGHGTFVAHILAVLRRNKKGRCSQSKQPQALQQVINAHGPVSGV